MSHGRLLRWLYADPACLLMAVTSQLPACPMIPNQRSSSQGHQLVTASALHKVVVWTAVVSRTQWGGDRAGGEHARCDTLGSGHRRRVVGQPQPELRPGGGEASADGRGGLDVGWPRQRHRRFRMLR